MKQKIREIFVKVSIVFVIIWIITIVALVYYIEDFSWLSCNMITFVWYIIYQLIYRVTKIIDKEVISVYVVYCLYTFSIFISNYILYNQHFEYYRENIKVTDFFDDDNENAVSRDDIFSYYYVLVIIVSLTILVWLNTTILLFDELYNINFIKSNNEANQNNIQLV